MHEAALTALMSANFRPVPFSEVTSNPGNDTDDDDGDEQPDPRCKRRRVALTALEISESPTLHWGHQCLDSGRGKPDWTLFSWDDFVPLVFADLGATSKKEQLRTYAVNALRLDCGVRYETGNNPAVLCIELNFGPLNGLLTGIKLYGYCVFKTERPSAGAPPESPIGEILLFESGTSDVEASLARVFHAALRHGAARGYSKCPFVLDSHKPTVARNKPTMYKIYHPHTDRSPDLMLEQIPGAEIVNTKGIAESVGKLLRYPYIEGSHMPANVAQVRAVLVQLQSVHAKNIVHADVRLWNMVFTEPPENSKLIDWDYAGRQAEARYPEGYVTDLPDARRHPRARELNVVKAEHDVFTMHDIMSRFTTGDHDAAHTLAWKACLDALAANRLQDAVAALDGHRFAITCTDARLCSLLCPNS